MYVEGAPARVRPSKLARSVIGILLISGVIGLGIAGVEAARGGRSSKDIPNAAWLAKLKPGGNDVIAVFAIDTEGNIQPFRGRFLGKPGQRVEYAPIEDPLHERDITLQIGNPKVCWTTNTGAEECVVYR